MDEEENYDMFFKNEIYPDPENIFENCQKKLENIEEDFVVVLDTNVLLMPYKIERTSLEEIKNVFKMLSQNERLFIPGQVAREFADERPEKLKNIYKELNEKISKISDLGEKKEYPFLENLEDYQSMLDLEEEINELIKEYRKKVNKIQDEIRSWNWDDPVSKVYYEIFNSDNIIKLQLCDDEKEKIEKKLQYRYKHQIPPGYKDSSKNDQGIGDFLIWKSILKKGNEREEDVIFVTQEKKPDWWHKSVDQRLYPRYELIDEFNRKTNGNTLHIINLSSLLDLYDVDEDIVTEIKEEESKKSKPDIEVSFGEIKSVKTRRYPYDKAKYDMKFENKRVQEIVEWFLSKYMVPAEGVPYDGQEGGYQYIFGGPYDPYEVIVNKFFDKYEESLIRKAANKLYKFGHEWVKREDY